MYDAAAESSELKNVPLFPLPDVVHFPGAILPLHIFEERYRAMVADSVDADRRIAMALLRPGWEKSYYGRPEIEPVVCVGTILSHERLPDGRYNLLLRGDVRARVQSESAPSDTRLYRVATLAPLAEIPADEEELAAHRRLFAELLESTPLSRISLAPQFRDMIGRGLPMKLIADVAAFALLDDVDLKQSLLAEPDVRKRIDRTLESLAATVAKIDNAIHAELN